MAECTSHDALAFNIGSNTTSVVVICHGVDVLIIVCGGGLKKGETV